MYTRVYVHVLHVRLSMCVCDCMCVVCVYLCLCVSITCLSHQPYGVSTPEPTFVSNVSPGAWLPLAPSQRTQESLPGLHSELAGTPRASATSKNVPVSHRWGRHREGCEDSLLRPEAARTGPEQQQEAQVSLTDTGPSGNTDNPNRKLSCVKHCIREQSPDKQRHQAQQSRPRVGCRHKARSKADTPWGLWLSPR